jgi:hypothetical protein
MTSHIKYILLWPTIVLTLHVLLTVTGGYYWWAYVDKIMHVLGGLGIGLSGLATIQLYITRGELKISNKLLTTTIALGLVALAAVSWEFLEFTLDHVAHTHMQPSLTDTMGDIFAGLCGGGIIILLKVFKKNK